MRAATDAARPRPEGIVDLPDATAGNGTGDLSALFRPSLLWWPERVSPSGWIEHIPFGFWLVDVLRPDTVVELGTQSGVSYLTFCQAVRQLNLPTRCFAVDTWTGDGHSGFYAEDVYRELSAYHGPRYGAFSRLVRCTFDQALEQFPDGSIDLLHIDGLHTYEAACHDFEAWRPKLSRRGVMLLHDTGVREAGFGVYRLWSEVAAGRRHFEFLHGNGLGVLGREHDYGAPLDLLFDASGDEGLTDSIRALFTRLGRSIDDPSRAMQAKAVQAMPPEPRPLMSNSEILRLAEEVEALRASTSWRITQPLRRASELIRRYSLRRKTNAGGDGTDFLRTIIMQSGLFDGEWYLRSYPDVADAGLDPLHHYMTRGAAEGRDPGPLFSTRAHFAKYPHVAGAGINPLVHHLRHAPAERAEDGAGSALNELKQTFRRHSHSALEAFLSEGRRIALPTSTQPAVTIVIVVFNQAELTFECLRSLSSALDRPSEVLIIDNASSDLTVELCARVDGARIIRNDANLHFLRAVNQAAAMARGDAVLLLNNDTRVRPGSIAAAYDLLHEQGSVGAVGGKIILFDGLLQEAGSIIWSDGSCVAYGRGKHPFLPEFRFRRAVDYCSGAFLLVRRTLLDRLNWLDTRFAPAYYEETDLCMRIREAGYRVVYEPGVEVLHFEFGSASAPAEALDLQTRNRKVFLERHRDALRKFHYPPGTRPILARIHGQTARRILVIDDGVPAPSLGRGYPRAHSLLQAIHRAGWLITFYPMTQTKVAWEEAYRLLPREIEIMADQGPAGLSSLIKERAGYYDAVMVSRPHNFKLVVELVKHDPQLFRRSKLIYDAEAIASEREALRLGLAGTPLSASERRERRASELAVAGDAALVVAVSERESQLIREAMAVETHVLGHEVRIEPTTTPFQDRSDILFVGALDDDVSPNVDSLVWFVNDIMPLLDHLLGSDYHLHVVGSNGSHDLKELAGPRVHLHGKVDDLGAHYARSRIFIAPTRYAAGIPMKVHEAAGAGLPVVATTLLADQLDWRDGVELLAADSAQDFAAACQRLYTDAQLWRRLRDGALARTQKDCSPAEFSRRVEALLRRIA